MDAVSPLVLVGVGLLGGVGALARFKVDRAVGRRWVRPFPYGTLTVNITSAFALGIVVGIALRGDSYRLIGTGLIGAYATFSTWVLETQRLAEEDDGRIAARDIILSVAAGVLIAWLGDKIGAAL